MKTKIYLAILFALFSSMWGKAQLTPLGTPNTVLPPSFANSSFSWFRGGNNAGGSAGTNNIFGTSATFNSPIYTETFGIIRTTLNGNKNSNTTAGLTPTNGFLGLNTQDPWSMLHINGPNNVSGFLPAGYRLWMRSGVFISENSDNMYVGLKPQFPPTNRSDAIINWGDDGGAVSDNLRFIFTSPLPPFGSGTPSTPDGLEVARMLANGNVGIGDFNTSGIQPIRRLEVVDGQSNNSQLRLTSTQNANPALGIHTDLFTSSTGGFFIDPRNTGAYGFVGINISVPPPLTINPNLGLWVNGQAAITQVNNDNTITKVLVWDDVTGPFGFGRVKWRAVNTIGAGIGTCAAPTVLSAGDGAIDLNTNANNFYFIGNGAGAAINNVCIGLLPVNCPAPAAKLDVLQQSGSLGTRGINVINNDNSSATSSSIGIYSRTSGNPTSGLTCRNIAGWFEARPAVGLTGAGFVIPQTGGMISLGFSTPFPAPPCFVPTNPQSLLEVNGHVAFNGNIYLAGTTLPYCDSRLKTNIASFTDGLSIVRQFNPISYYYNGLAQTHTNKQHYGVVAQDLFQFAPYIVDTTQIRINHNDTAFTDIYAIRTDAVLYTSINAIKQLDSALTKVASVPDAPILISPADGAVGDFRKATFTWHSVSTGIVFYRAQAATDIAFTNIVRDQRGITDTATSFDLPCDTVSATYYWRVNATNNTGASSFSQVFSFTDTAKCGKTPSPSPDPIRALQAVSFNSTSDSNFKTNIAPVTNALDKVSQLSGVYYDWVHTNPNYEFDSTQQIGFIAQDVQAVVPQVVRADSNGYLTLDYGRVVPVLVEAIKELKAWKDSVSNNSMRTINNNVPSTDMELASQNAILYQNTPNPFGDGTSIGYFVSENTTDAYLVFYDEFGNEIKKAELPYRGQNAKLNLTTYNLASGIYTYSLVVNGKIEDTKKMLKTK